MYNVTSVYPFTPNWLFYLASSNRSNIMGVRLIFIITMIYRNTWILYKQCRLWSGAAFCGVWSESTLFGKVPFNWTLGINGLLRTEWLPLWQKWITLVPLFPSHLLVPRSQGPIPLEAETSAWLRTCTLRMQRELPCHPSIISMWLKCCWKKHKNTSSQSRWLGCASDLLSGVCGFGPAGPRRVGNNLLLRLNIKYFLRSFSPFRFKKGSCQFLAKAWLTAELTA